MHWSERFTWSGHCQWHQHCVVFSIYIFCKRSNIYVMCVCVCVVEYIKNTSTLHPSGISIAYSLFSSPQASSCEHFSTHFPCWPAKEWLRQYWRWMSVRWLWGVVQQRGFPPLTLSVRIQCRCNHCGSVGFPGREQCVMGNNVVSSKLSSLAGYCVFHVDGGRSEMLTSCWYFPASRNHGVYPICREEAVRLLRSTRMARAYSEGAYSSSSDYDFERYCHALLLHPCIRHLVVPSSVFNLPVIVHVMTANYIWSRYRVLLKSVITALKLRRCERVIYYTTASVCGGLRALCPLVVGLSAGQHLPVYLLMSLFMSPCTLYQQQYVAQWCVWIGVLSLMLTCYWQLHITCTMHCSRLHSSLVNSMFCPLTSSVWPGIGLPGRSEQPWKGLLAPIQK